MTDDLALQINHIRAKEKTGTPYIAGTRFSVAFVAGLYHFHEMSVEEICEEYSLSPGQVHAALSYYADHKEEIDRREREVAERLDQYFKEHPEADVRQRFIERKKNREGH